MLANSQLTTKVTPRGCPHSVPGRLRRVALLCERALTARLGRLAAWLVSVCSLSRMFVSVRSLFAMGPGRWVVSGCSLLRRLA